MELIFFGLTIIVAFILGYSIGITKTFDNKGVKNTNYRSYKDPIKRCVRCGRKHNRWSNECLSCEDYRHGM